jgi:putative toxin-antitoxin system antitoxin component (TIGR02293 family)
MPSPKVITQKSPTARPVAGRREHSGAPTFPTPTPAHESARILGIPASDASTLIRRVRQGFPFAAVERLQQAFALSADELTTLVQIPTRTMTRRKVTGRLKPDESDRVLRAVRLMHRATVLFNNDPAAAKTWMTTPQRGLGGAVPLDLAGTEVGAREVEDALGRIEDGVFA